MSNFYFDNDTFQMRGVSPFQSRKPTPSYFEVVRSGWFPRTFSYGGRAPGEGVGSTFDPTAPFFFMPSESMQALSALTFGPTEQPEPRDVNLATDLSSEAIEGAEDGDTHKKANNEPDANSNTTKPTKDAKVIDPNRFSKKVAIYYDPNLHANIIRTSDTTGSLTDLPAKDTLPH